MTAPDKAGAPTLLHRTTLEHPTRFWNDGCEDKTLLRALEQGATGATSNPVLVLEAIEADPSRWREHTKRLARDFPTETEDDLAFRLVAEVAGHAADLLLPLFERDPRQGRLCLQVGPKAFVSAPAMIHQARGFSRLRRNMAVKVPAVAAGLEAIEELTAQGVVINATVLFTLPQAVAVAEAMERGLDRAKRDGIDTSVMTPWVTIMVGRLDDHLRDAAKAEGAAISPEAAQSAGVAVMKKAYRLFRERGYRATLLSAAMRSHHHWSSFVGGEVVVTIPPPWQEKFNASGIELRARMDEEVSPAAIEELSRLEDFRRAYDEKGLRPEEFVAYGASKKTLHQFLGGYDKLVGFVRSAMIPLD